MRKTNDNAVKFIKQNNSTPIPYYITLFIVTAVLLIIGKISGDDLIKNVGYSLLASIIAAICIDVGNTNAKRKEEERELCIISAEYVHAFMKLRKSVVDAYEMRYNCDKEKRSFEQWLEQALNENYLDEELTEEFFDDIAWEVEWAVKQIRKTSEVLKDRLLIHVGLSVVSDEYRRHVNRIEGISSVIEREFDEKEYRFAKKNILKKLIPCFIANHPQFRNLFLEAYSSDEDDG